jgi:hypothetical protein
MTKEEILNALETLSKNQGFYSGLYLKLKNDDRSLDELAKLHFRDIIDLVLYFES